MQPIPGPFYIEYAYVIMCVGYGLMYISKVISKAISRYQIYTEDITLVIIKVKVPFTHTDNDDELFYDPQP